MDKSKLIKTFHDFVREGHNEDELFNFFGESSLNDEQKIEMIFDTNIYQYLSYGHKFSRIMFTIFRRCSMYPYKRGAGIGYSFLEFLGGSKLLFEQECIIYKISDNTPEYKKGVTEFYLSFNHYVFEQKCYFNPIDLFI